jgi:hypothetical protein
MQLIFYIIGICIAGSAGYWLGYGKGFNQGLKQGKQWSFRAANGISVRNPKKPVWKCFKWL